MPALDLDAKVLSIGDKSKILFRQKPFPNPLFLI
jgi:hypothetical protein